MSETSPVHGRLRRPVLLVLLYTLLGPPLGAALIFVPLAAIGLLSGQPMDAGAVLLAIAFSYFAGGIPAFAAGLLVVALSSQTGEPAAYPAVAAIGAGTAFVLPLLQQVVSGPPGGQSPPLSLFALFGLAGAAAATIIRRLGHRLHETPP